MLSFLKPGRQAPRGRPNPALPAADSQSAGPANGNLVRFEAIAEDWRISGEISSASPLAEALGRQESLSITRARWAPLNGTESFSEAPGLKRLDPYSIIALVADEGVPPIVNRARTPYFVHLALGGLEAKGTVYLSPGQEIEQLIGRDRNIFIALFEGEVSLGEIRIGPPGAKTILLNRAYLERIDASGRGDTCLRWRRVEDRGELAALEDRGND